MVYECEKQARAKRRALNYSQHYWGHSRPCIAIVIQLAEYGSLKSSQSTKLASWRLVGKQICTAVSDAVLY